VAHRVTLIPGDGVGPEVIDAARYVLEATGVAFDWDRRDAGAERYEREGDDPLPAAVIESIRERGIALKGPTSTPTGQGFRSINLRLRDELDLFAGIRPCKAFDGVHSVRASVDVVIVRMNHEDLYAGIEYAHDTNDGAALREFIDRTQGRRLAEDAGLSIKPLSSSASERVIRYAFEYARAHGRRKVTAVHKATVMRHTDGLFLRTASAVCADYPDIEFEERLVDAMAAELVAHPERCDVLVLPVMYGDILSDLAAALVGGLGLAPGMNVGDRVAVFEAVHGTVPKHRGRDRVNPAAAILSGALMLRHIGEQDAAAQVEMAIGDVIREGSALTYDLQPSSRASRAAGTREFAEAVVAALGRS
jgi:isocitrate dehydrogenase (NAD+)